MTTQQKQVIKNCQRFMVATIFYIWVSRQSSPLRHWVINSHNEPLPSLLHIRDFLDFEAKKRIAVESLQAPLAGHCCH